MSPFGAVPLGYIVLGLSFASVLLAVVGTWPVCALLLRAYRRRIGRGMRSSSSCGVEPPGSPAPTPAHAATRIKFREADGGRWQPTLELARRRARRMQVLFCLAGLAYAVTATAAFYIVDHKEWRALRALAYIGLFGWPLVPTLLALSLARARVRWMAYAVHLAVVLLLLALAGLDGGEVVVVMVIPGVFVLALGARPLRGAAWLVAPGLVVLGLAIAALYVAGVYLAVGATFDVYAWSFLAAGLGLVVLLAAYTWLVARTYAAKWASDQTLLILQWWLVTSMCWSLLLGTQGMRAALLGLASYGVLVLFLVVGALVGRPAADTPVRLLLLRTFGARQRSSRLLYDLTRQWRWIGSVELITGTDLASEILEPDEFLDFLLGRTSRQFVQDPASLPTRLEELDLRPDRDGRYRVNELLCTEDTWRPAVEKLIEDVDVVLIDLRGLTMDHQGVVHELELLVATMPLRQVVALVDATTDQQALQWALDRASSLAPPSSPLWRDPAPELGVVVVSLGGSVDPEALMSALAQAAPSARRADAEH